MNMGGSLSGTVAQTKGEQNKKGCPDQRQNPTRTYSGFRKCSCSFSTFVESENVKM